jgi:uracil-DNA glycosylase
MGEAAPSERTIPEPLPGRPPARRTPLETPMPKTDWNPILKSELTKPYWAELQQFVRNERQHHAVYPPDADVFAALHLTPFASVRVVVLGQDPYHGPGQAHGLCFSVRPPTPPPPSLVNIFKELESDLGIARPAHGSLESWARQGVLLLNTTLTVRAHQAASHRNQGWEIFTDAIVQAVDAKPEPVVFVLWGSAARKKKALLDRRRHIVVEAPHPSPLSAHRGFFGSRPFSTINAALETAGRGSIDWSL